MFVRLRRVVAALPLAMASLLPGCIFIVGGDLDLSAYDRFEPMVPGAYEVCAIADGPPDCVTGEVTIVDTPIGQIYSAPVTQEAGGNIQIAFFDSAETGQFALILQTQLEGVLLATVAEAGPAGTTVLYVPVCNRSDHRAVGMIVELVGGEAGPHVCEAPGSALAPLLRAIRAADAEIVRGTLTLRPAE